MIRSLATLLKLAIATGLVVFLVATDRLSLEPFRAVLSQPIVLVELVALQLVITALGVLRWWLLLRAVDGVQHSFLRLFAYTWVGLFFGCVAPSQIATDIVRYRYLRQGNVMPSSIATSILADRLCGIASIALLALVFTPRLLVELVDTERLVIIGVVIAAATILVIATIRLRHRLRLDGVLTRTARAWRAVLAARSTSIAAVGIGFVAHALKVVSLWIIVDAVGDVSLATIFAFAPIGFVFEAIPLAPGGLGTAHLAFEHLFGMAGLSNGAALFNVYFLVRMATSLMGGFLWVAGPQTTRVEDRKLG